MPDRLTPEGERVEAFLVWAEGLSDTEPRFVKPDDSHITGIVFEDEPEPGWRVMLTYGLSTFATEVGNELMLMVNSTEDPWLHELMQAADERQHLSGQLQAGMTSLWPERIGTDSEMTGFVLWDPFALPEGVSEVVHLPGRHVVVLQAIPLHWKEVEWLRNVPEVERRRAVVELLGPLGEAMYDVTRQPMR